MPKSVDAIVTPKLLRWSRLTSGYSVEAAAKALRLPAAKLAAWENGETLPTIVQAKRLAHLYRRPLAIFYLQEPPPTKDLPPDYRTMQRQIVGIAPVVRHAIRRARAQRDAYLDILDSLEQQPSVFKLSLRQSDGVALCAQSLRKQLGVSWEQQSKVKPETALSLWQDAIERAGVLVFQTESTPHDVTPDEMRGASLYAKVAPVILITGRDARPAKLFTLLHEVVHLALHTDSLCDLTEGDPIEVFCNAVAGCTLVPGDLLNSQISDLGLTNLDDDNAIAMLAARFRVSEDCLARRLMTQGYISPESYRARHEAYTARAEAYKRRAKSEQKGGPRREYMIVRNSGRPFATAVFEALRSGDITYPQAHDYLQARSRKVFEQVEQVLQTG